MEDKTTHDHSARGIAEALNYLLGMLADETARRLRPEGRSEVDSKPQTTSPTADNERDAGDDISASVYERGWRT